MSGRPSWKSAKIGLFPEGAKSTWGIQKMEEKGLFPQISSDLLIPPSLKPPCICATPMNLQDAQDDLLKDAFGSCVARSPSSRKPLALPPSLRPPPPIPPNFANFPEGL